jgi:hypothetical protein
MGKIPIRVSYLSGGVEKIRNSLKI